MEIDTTKLIDFSISSDSGNYKVLQLNIPHQTYDDTIWKRDYQLSAHQCSGIYEICGNVNGTYKYGDSIKLSATPEQYHKFSHWIDNNGNKYTSQEIEFAIGPYSTAFDVIKQIHELSAFGSTGYYTITYKPNGGKGEDKSYSIQQDKTHKTLASNTYYKTINSQNMPLSVWNTKKDGTGTTYKCKTSFTVNKNLTLYAIFPKYVKVKFDADGGKMEIDQKTVETYTTVLIYGKKYGTLPTPTKESNAFLGWYLNGKTKITSSTIVSTSKTHTITAKWKQSVSYWYWNQIGYTTDKKVFDAWQASFVSSDQITNDKAAQHQGVTVKTIYQTQYQTSYRLLRSTLYQS